MILELKDIRFRGLNLVNLAVKEGEVAAIIGGNGSGKTTLFNIISGIEKGAQGSAYFEGRNLIGKSVCSISKMGIGRLFQGCQLMGDLTLMENMKVASTDLTGEGPLDCFFRFRKTAESESKKEQRAIDILKKVFGDDNKYLSMLDHKASELSYGEQRLIALTRLLMGDNRLMLLDEPTSGVNPKYVNVFVSIIREMVEKEGRTVLLIEHNMSFVRRVADSCHYLADGTIIKSGPTNDVLDDPVIRKDYLGL